MVGVKNKNEYRYYVDGGNSGPEDSYSLRVVWGENHLDYIAEEAAEDYHYNHDGWEDSWPLTIVILDLHMKEIGRCEVEREAVPQFSATVVKSKKDEP